MMLSRYQKTLMMASIMLASLMLLFAGWLWLHRVPSVSSNPGPANISDAATQVQVDGQAAVSGLPESSPEQAAASPMRTPKAYDGGGFARSLAGTDIDGRLQADSSGHLLVSIDVKDFFDYFLNTVGEVSPEDALAEIERLAHTYLPPEAAQEAMVLLDQYLEYKQTSLDLMQQPLLPVEQQTAEYHLTVLTNSLEQLKQIRRRIMNAEVVDAFFGMEESYAEYTLAKMAIQQDNSLTVAEKQQLMAEKRQQLPMELRAVDEELERSAMRAEQAVTLLNKAETELTLRQGLQHLNYPPAQIDELVADWNAQHQFETLYAQYAAQKEQVQQAGLASADQEQQIASLQSRYFPSEEERVQARLRDLSN